MNTLLLIDKFSPDQIGGMWETAQQLRSTFEHQGHSVFVLTNGRPSPGENPNRIRRTGRGLLIGSILIIFSLRRFCKENSIDVIHAHQPLSSPGLFFIKIFNRNTRLVSTFQTTYFEEFKSVSIRRIGQKLYRPTLIEYLQKYIFAPLHILFDFISYLLADDVTAVSADVKEQLKNSYGVLCHKDVNLIPNGAPQTSAEITSKESKVIFFAGAFRARKGIWELLNAFKEMKFNDRELVIAGCGRGYERKIKKEIKLLGIEGRVRLLGRITNSEVLNWLSQCEVFCLPSLMEGHPLVLLEAMSAGTAIVATSIGGVNETIRNNINGILVPPGDLAELQKALDRLISQPKLREELGKGALLTAKKEYQWDDIARKYIELFKREDLS